MQYNCFANACNYYANWGSAALYFSADAARAGAVSYYKPLAETYNENGMREEFQWKTYEDPATDTCSFDGQASNMFCSSTDPCYCDPNSVQVPTGPRRFLIHRSARKGASSVRSGFSNFEKPWLQRAHVARLTTSFSPIAAGKTCSSVRATDFE